MSQIGLELVKWYTKHKRDLAWRETQQDATDPYRVWLSEIMLQQTTVAGATPYFIKFINRFPKIEDLASASLEEILDMWAGLGYYARARNLHLCARTICEQHNRQFPKDEASLLALPGIGPYTAGAIIAIAFNKPAIALDGNAKRVIARLFALRKPLNQIEKQLRSHYSEILHSPRPSEFAQAMMDLGATLCTPKNPKCLHCPLNRFCQAKQHTHAIPARIAKVPLPVRQGALLHIRSQALPAPQALMRRRTSKSMLGGCIEFIGTAWDNKECEQDNQRWRRELQELYTQLNLGNLGNRVKIKQKSGFKNYIQHSFTHYKLNLHLYRLDLSLTQFEHIEQFLGRQCGAFRVTESHISSMFLPSLMRKAAIEFLP